MSVVRCPECGARWTDTRTCKHREARRSDWAFVRKLWIVTLLAWLLAGVVFGGALLGDEIGLWAFDSGLGAENGDPR